jgi:uncharacterized protein YutE (UPF0331/DUF86 family)
VPLEDTLSSPKKRSQKESQFQKSKMLAAQISNINKDVLKRQFSALLDSISDTPDVFVVPHALSDEEFQPFDESDIATKLSTTILTLELTSRFKELFDLRNSVILLSHCAGYLVILIILCSILFFSCRSLC